MSILPIPDFSDVAFLNDPYPALQAIREATPIFRNEITSQWMLTRFTDVFEALRDRRMGRAERLDPQTAAKHVTVSEWPDFEAQERWSLLSIEPPDHTRIRRLLTKVFTPKAVQELRPAMESTAEELLDRYAAGPDFDLIADYAQQFSVSVICSLLGVPFERSEDLLRWSHATVKMYELSSTLAQKAEANQSAIEFIAFVSGLIAERRRQPDDLLISALVSAESEGERLTEAEVVSTVIVLLNAGHEATVNSLGNGIRAFARHPGEWQRVVDGAVRARTAIEEMIRWDPPLQLFERWVNEDGVEIAGQPIARGEKIAMLFGAANRDPRRFEEPDRFDAARGDTAHIGFGGGIHFCIGAPLARLELEVSVEALRRRLRTIDLSEEPVYHPNFVIHGLRSMRISNR